MRSIFVRVKEYGVVTEEFLTKIHLDHFRHCGEYYDKICRRVNQFSYYVTLLMVVIAALGLNFFNIVPIYNNFKYRNDDDAVTQYSIYLSLPGVNQDMLYTFSTIYNYYISVMCAVLVCGIDLLMFVMAFHVVGHIMTLRDDINSLPKPKCKLAIDPVHMKNKYQTDLHVEIYDNEENDVIREELIKCIDHHATIVSFAGALSDLFGPILAVSYVNHLVCGALMLLVCTTGDRNSVVRCIPVTIVVFSQLAQISVIFEIMGSESAKLMDAVYSVQWECMSASNRKLVHMFLTKVQTPIRVTALGMVDVGVEAMVAILKTTFSYYTLLQSLGE
uniref:Odorant receptor 3 n=1 Tax=Conogethes pinicolalis TaxID=1178461 RepID=A0A5B9GEB6_9NEOP|nr:odorant receptor 3 [Conogethes pinicolalis]